MIKESLQSQYPMIAKEWHPTLNGDLLPSHIAKASSKKVWWLCPKGHEYPCTVDKRTKRRYGCPCCSGKKTLAGYNDLQTKRPDLVLDWNYFENDKLGIYPDEITPGCNKRVSWKCHVCGHEWTTKVNDRSQGRDCPECSKIKRIKSFRENTYLRRGENDLETLNPDFLCEWNHDLNGEKKPSDFTANSKESIMWTCSICGFTWPATISNRYNRNSGCPKCMKHRRTSFPEQAIFFYLMKAYADVENAYTDIFSDKTELDIYIPSIRVGIEYDGIAWHSNDRATKKAKQKYETCKSQGITLIRVSEIKVASDRYSDKYIYRDSLSVNGLNVAIKDLLGFLGLKDINVDVSRDRADIIRQYVTVIKNKSIAVRAPELVSEWDVEANDGLTAEMVNSTSNISYYWRCHLNHIYLASPANRSSSKNGCPYCSNHRVWPGFNDLETKYPQIAKYWDNQRNEKKVSEVLPGSQVKYHWICPKGHPFVSSPNNMVYAKGSGCSVCAGKVALEGETDLKTTEPEVLKFWDYEENEKRDLYPEKVTKGSNKEACWKCELGHKWPKRIHSQVLYNSCPYCEDRELLTGFNDLKTRHPELVAEWDYEHNTIISPEGILSSCRTKVWWKCRICKNIWKTSPCYRLYNKSGCPECGYSRKIRETWGDRIQKEHKDLVSLFPEIATEWDYERNVGLDPHRLAPNSRNRVWWICPNGHHYQACMSYRVGEHYKGCKECNKVIRRLAKQ